MKKILSLLLTVSLTIYTKESLAKADGSFYYYEQAFEEQLQMLNGTHSIDFKRAVFVSENAYLNGSLDYGKFCNDLKSITNQLTALIKERGLGQYKTSGNWAVFTYMMDSIPLNHYKPYTYDFDDFLGEKDWKHTFVTNLLITKSGNCHSLPILYKLLCDEMNAKASLALAPNHLYIKHINEQGQWSNLELTNGGFPRDQWIIQQMAITVEAIKNGVYMQPLTDKENIAFTMFDLISAYENQHGYDNFFLKVADTALHYYPKCIPLLMMKANYYRHFGEAEKRKENPDLVYLRENHTIYKSMLQTIDSLGYKDMPIEQYEEWIKEVEGEKAKRGIAIKTNEHPK